MTGKSKKELQNENNVLKKELSEIRISYAQLSKKSTSNVKCNKCDNSFERMTKVKKPQEDHNSLNLSFRCDQCYKVFNEKWKMDAHQRACKIYRCDFCDQTVRYKD